MASKITVSAAISLGLLRRLEAEQEARGGQDAPTLSAIIREALVLGLPELERRRIPGKYPPPEAA